MPGGREYRDARRGWGDGIESYKLEVGTDKPDEAWIPGGENEAVAVVDCKFGWQKLEGVACKLQLADKHSVMV